MRHPLFAQAKQIIGVAALLSAACQTTTTDRPSAPIIAPDPDALLKLPPVQVAAAPWLERVEDGSFYSPQLGEPKMLAVGQDLAVHRTRLGLMVTSLSLGVLGQLELPEDAVWVGMTGQDTLLVALRDGSILSAAALDLVPKLALKPALTLKDARAWDANGPWFVAAKGDEVYVSRDDLSAGQWRKVSPGLELRQVFVRADGVIVAYGIRGQDTRLRYTYISTDGGATFKESSYQPDQLRRDGSWIWNADMNCVGVLSADGQTWSADPDLTNLPGHDGERAQQLSLSDSLKPAPPGALKQTTYRSPPSPPKPSPQLTHQGRAPSCQDPIPTAASLARAQAMTAQDQASDRGPQPPACLGTRCLLRATAPPLPTSPTTHLLLSDGRCDAQRCERAPHSVVIDAVGERVEVAALPEGCRPSQLFSALGLGVLACTGEDGALTLYSRDKQRGWTQEHQAPHATSFAGVSVSAQDGTLVLHGRCDARGCSPSLLRAPVAVGQLKAPWRRVALDDALWVYPATGGRALALSAPVNAAHDTLGLWLIHEDGRATKLRTVGQLDQPVRGAMLGEDELVILRLGDEFMASSWVMRGAGPLERLR